MAVADPALESESVNRGGERGLLQYSSRVRWVQGPSLNSSVFRLVWFRGWSVQLNRGQGFEKLVLLLRLQAQTSMGKQAPTVVY